MPETSSAANVDLADYDWLCSGDAQVWIALAGDDAVSLVTRTQRLRVALSPTRTHLALELAELRRRGRAKFARAADMFFAPQALEQATDEHLAAYKARRFAGQSPVADLCCGLGGDALAIAAAGVTVVGMDLNAVAARLAAANASALGLRALSIEQADVRGVDPTSFAAWHIDPDRRSSGQRTSALDWSEPGLDEIERWRRAVPHGAVKLAPSAEIPVEWELAAEREWLGHDRECKQQVAWFGELAHATGQRRATVVNTQLDSESIAGEPQSLPCSTNEIGPYVYEPHSAVLTAELAGALAEREGWSTLGDEACYFTGEAETRSLLYGTFAVQAVFPYDVPQLRQAIRAREIGDLEIKKRGALLDPREVRRQLRPAGPNASVLLLARVAGRTLAILAQRHR